MNLIKRFFKREKDKKEKSEDIFYKPKEEFKYICKACNEGIDPTFHKWTKQQGSYFHKVCWKNALNYANKKGII
jgi:hypothetical protein